MAIKSLVIASHNPGKVAEIEALLKPYGVQVHSAAAFNLSEPEETGTTFAENAILKAEAAAKASGHLCLADDSGLSVKALNGDPGIYSARWGGPEKDFSLAMNKVWQALQQKQSTDLSAAFHCVLALAGPDQETQTFSGICPGHLVWPPRGTQGFGYDPMFIPKGGEKTFGELPPEEKEKVNHRTYAFEKFVSACFETQQ